MNTINYNELKTQQTAYTIDINLNDKIKIINLDRRTKLIHYGNRRNTFSERDNSVEFIEAGTYEFKNMFTNKQMLIVNVI